MPNVKQGCCEHKLKCFDLTLWRNRIEVYRLRGGHSNHHTRRRVTPNFRSSNLPSQQFNPPMDWCRNLRILVCYIISYILKPLWKKCFDESTFKASLNRKLQARCWINGNHILHLTLKAGCIDFQCKCFLLNPEKNWRKSVC